MALPDFSNPSTFPSFTTCPDTSSPPSDDNHFLLGQIGENMTITRPTLVLTDRAGTSFATMFAGQINLASRGLKKGNTAVVPGARRTPPKDDRGQGFIAVAPELFDSIKSLPGNLEKVFEVGGRMREGDGEEEGSCNSCGKKGEGLRQCKGCEGVRYCGKVS